MYCLCVRASERQNFAYLLESMRHSQDPGADKRNEYIGEHLDGTFGSIILMHSTEYDI